MKIFAASRLSRKITTLTVLMFLLATVFLQTRSANAHCDSIDGPVVMAAKKALEKGNINYVLPYVYEDGEAEIRKAYQTTMETRKAGPDVRDIVDQWFYETVVRVHRTGEGATYYGLKPANIDYGPALPAAVNALQTGSTTEVKQLILETIETELDKRFAEIKDLPTAVNNVTQARKRVQAELMFEKYVHQIYGDITSIPGHGEAGEAGAHEGAEGGVHQHSVGQFHGHGGEFQGINVKIKKHTIVPNGTFNNK